MPPPLRGRVLPLLLLLGLVAVLSLAFVTVAPNRLVTGRGMALVELLRGVQAWALLPPLALLVAAALGEPTRLRCAFAAISGALLLAVWAWLAGGEALQQSLRAAAAAQAAGVGSPSTLRVSFGGAFWCLMLLAWLVAADALQRLHLRPLWHATAHVGLWLPLLAVLLGGQLDELSILKEWVQREEVFREAFWRHLQIVAAALLPALLLGLPLGVAVARHARLGRAVLAVLGVVQTIPSIALFGLLIAPLAALGALWPASGIQGVGLAPALVALVAYALLPLVHGVAAGLQQIEPGVIEAANGMGLSAPQRLWRVELPLALPALLSALRVAAVQMVGLAVVAALIGAGGLGALIFQGLAGSALDLVLLGVVPVVVLAVVFDAAFGALAATLRARGAGA